MKRHRIEGDIGRGPFAYLRARRQGRIAYDNRGGWLRWKVEGALRRRLRTDGDRKERSELVELRRFVLFHVPRTPEGRALLESYERRHATHPDDSPAVRQLGRRDG